MVTIIIFVVAFIACVLWALFGKKNDDLGAIFGTLIFFVLLGLSCSFININKRFDCIIEEYDNLKMQVEAYNAMDDDIKVSSLEYDIRKEVLKMNNQISRHKVMSKSVWVNLWYSDKVGNLEKLRLDQ